MDLGAYLERIGYTGPPGASVASLVSLHRHHLFAIPYENIDVQLGRPLDLDPASAFEKVVKRRRGGWCYEMNGVFGQALEAIGFEVARLVGGVFRKNQGDEALGNHLVLRVELDVPWIADVGLGDGTLEPYPLRTGRFEQGGRAYALESLAAGEWRWRNQEGRIPPDFDFIEAPDEGLLARTCQRLQDDPESPFRKNLLVMRPDPAGGTRLLIGRVLALPGEEKRVLADSTELEATLAEEFGIEDPDIASLWTQVAARHEELFGSAHDVTGAKE